MKKTFGENRLVAWVVFAACVLFSLSFSGGRALANLRGETEQIFYQGVYGDGLCIDRDLEEIARCTQQMAELAQGYAGAGNGLAEAALQAGQREQERLERQRQRRHSLAPSALRHGAPAPLTPEQEILQDIVRARRNGVL